MIKTAVKAILQTTVLVVFSLSALADDIKPIAPTPSITPGSVCTRNDSDFTEYRYKEHIPYCERNVPYQQKIQIYEVYAVKKSARSNYTIDHFIPLSMGGNNDDENLWPEHVKIKALRQNLEYETYERLLNGEINQKEAIDIIVQAKMHPPIDILALQGVLYEDPSGDFVGQ